MKLLILSATLVSLLGTGKAASPKLPVTEKPIHCATCVGDTPCNACKNCKYCGLCAKRGGKCGVCAPGKR